VRYTEEARLAVFEAAGWKCRVCGRTGNLTIDHIIPRSKGGTNKRSNLQALCRACNEAKADAVPLGYEYPSIQPAPTVYLDCPRCDGHGVLDRPFGRRCSECSATGRVTRREFLEIRRRVRRIPLRRKTRSSA
jgi:hypothetical protein